MQTGGTRSDSVFVLTQGIKPGGTRNHSAFVLTQGIKPGGTRNHSAFVLTQGIKPEGTRSDSVFVSTRGIKPGGTRGSPVFALTRGIKPARSAWVLSVCSSSSELALSCCLLGESELLMSERCTKPATAMRIKCNSQGNISEPS